MLEPYVTNRIAGTGLGLSIVVKTIEEHRGTFSLSGAESFDNSTVVGAKAVVKLPRITKSISQ